MSLTVSILQGGTNSHVTTSEEVNFTRTDVMAPGVIGTITNTSGVAPATGAFAVNAQGTPDATVAVSSGVCLVTATPTSGNSQLLRVSNSASANVTITANSTGGTRYDWIYVKVDPDKAKDPASDASDVATLVTSRSTSATTDNGTPPTYGTVLAVVTVANGFSTITNGNIADARVRTGFRGNWIDSNGNEIAKASGTASAVNEITVTNAATGNAPQISATGGDTNIDLNLSGKGTGQVKFPAANKTTDANGWTVYEYGAWKEYKKAVTFSATFAAGGTVSLSSTNLPVGMSSIGTNVVSHALFTNAFGYDLSFNFEMTTSSTALAASAKCISGNGRTYTCVVYVTITSV